MKKKVGNTQTNSYQNNNNPTNNQNVSQNPKSSNSHNQANKAYKQYNSKVSSTVKKLLLFPGEDYEFNSSLIHYDAFGYSDGNLVTKRCGVLLTDDKGKALDPGQEEVFKSLGQYYSPKVDDVVVGIIVQKSAEFYKVDINTYTQAILNSKDFEGATKKSKPNLNLGDLVFARVSKVNKFDTPILSCISVHEHKNWASGESFFGVLKGGNVFSFNKLNTWDFYGQDNYALNRLRDVVSYEIVIGFNGRMWIKSDGEAGRDTYTVYNILMKSVNTTQEEVEKEIHNAFINKMRD